MYRFVLLIAALPAMAQFRGAGESIVVVRYAVRGAPAGMSAQYGRAQVGLALTTWCAAIRCTPAVSEWETADVRVEYTDRDSCTGSCNGTSCTWSPWLAAWQYGAAGEKYGCALVPPLPKPPAWTVRLNAGASFEGICCLTRYSLVLHEVGHNLGIRENLSAPVGVMGANGETLSAEDIQAVRAAWQSGPPVGEVVHAREAGAVPRGGR